MGFFDRFKSKFARRDEMRSSRVADIKPAPMAHQDTIDAPTHAAPPSGTPPARTAYRVLAHPLVTEKSATLATSGTYAFMIPTSATRIEVKNAVHEVYGTRPEAVRIVRSAGKAVRFGQKSGQRKDTKKALVTMPKGKTLPIYD